MQLTTKQTAVTINNIIIAYTAQFIYPTTSNVTSLEIPIDIAIIIEFDNNSL